MGVSGLNIVQVIFYIDRYRYLVVKKEINGIFIVQIIVREKTTILILQIDT